MTSAILKHSSREDMLSSVSIASSLTMYSSLGVRFVNSRTPDKSSVACFMSRRSPEEAADSSALPLWMLLYEDTV